MTLALPDPAYLVHEERAEKERGEGIPLDELKQEIQAHLARWKAE